MTMEEEIKAAFKDSVFKSVAKTFEFLETINKERVLKIASSIPIINGVNMTIKKATRCYEFESEGLNLVEEPVKYQDQGYGYFRPFSIKNDNEEIIVPNGVGKIKLSFGGRTKTKGTLTEIESNFSRGSNSYYRAIIPVKDEIIRLPYYYIQGEKFKTDKSFRLGGLIKFSIAGKRIDLFDYKTKNERRFLFVDSMNFCKYEEFEKQISAIVYSLGFIGGYTNRDEIYYFEGLDNTFTEFKGFCFRKIEDSIYSGMEILSPHIMSMRGKNNLAKEKCYLSNETFSTLVTKAFGDKRLLRALKIICESNIYSLEIRASAYSVALETIKNIIIEENEERITPFKNKNEAKEARLKILELISKLDDNIFNNKQAVLNRIEQLNQVTNKDSFKIAFKIYGIKLNIDDEAALEKRNDFLHGRIPFEDEKSLDTNKELQFITYKLHFLVTSLILKYCGFNGLVKNNPKFFEVLSSGKEIDEPLFRSI